MVLLYRDTAVVAFVINHLVRILFHEPGIRQHILRTRQKSWAYFMAGCFLVSSSHGPSWTKAGCVGKDIVVLGMLQEGIVDVFFGRNQMFDCLDQMRN